MSTHRATAEAQRPVLDRISRNDVLVLAALVLAGVGIPLSMAAVAGTIGLPSNDDWVYMRAATSLFTTGHVEVSGHTAAFVGQMVLVQPFLWLSGGNAWAFTAFGLVAAAIGIGSTYLLARRFVETIPAVTVVLLIGVFPGFARESASFMTDGPAYAFAMLSLLLGTRWLLDAGGRTGLVASVAVGLVGASIREFAIAAPIAVLVTAWARNRTQDRILLGTLSILLAAGFEAILAVAASLPGHGGAAAPDVGRVVFLGPALVTLAAVLLPATILYVGRRVASYSPSLILLGAGLGCLVVSLPYGPLLGNLWSADGLTGNAVLAGTRAPVFGDLIWGVSSELAIFGAILAALVTLRWGQRNVAGVSSLSRASARALAIVRSRHGLLLVFLLGYAAEIVLFGSLGLLFDRYLYPMVPIAAILLLRGPGGPVVLGRRHRFAHLALVWLAASSFVIAANSFAYDAARDREGRAAVALGYDAETVDAGYEWVGSHASSVVDPDVVPSASNRWAAIAPSLIPCALVSNSPLDPGNPFEAGPYQLVRVDRSAYRQLLFFGPPQPLYLYGRIQNGCPPPPTVPDAP